MDSGERLLFRWVCAAWKKRRYVLFIFLIAFGALYIYFLLNGKSKENNYPNSIDVNVTTMPVITATFDEKPSDYDMSYHFERKTVPYETTLDRH